MSEFLMVVPEGWTEISNPADMTGLDTFQNSAPVDVTQMLLTRGDLPADDSLEVSEFRVFMDGSIMRLWVKISQHIV